MNVTYDPEADVLCFMLRDRPPVDAVEEPNGIIVSYGTDEEPVSVEFLDASERGLTSGGELSVTLQTGARHVTPS